MSRVLVTRPAEQSAATIERLLALDHDPVIAPLFALQSRPWTPPAGEFDALMLTSAAATSFAGAGLRLYRALPCYCIGERTAAAAAISGFSEVRADGWSGAQDMLAAMAAAGVRRALHLAGRDVTAARLPHGLELVRRTVYAAMERTWSAEEARAAAGADTALVYSARGGAVLAAALTQRQRSRMTLAAISAAAASAAGGGWRNSAVAAHPHEAALFAAAGLVCDKRGDGR